MVGLADQGATGALNVAGQDTIYIEAIVEGRSRDIVIEVECNDQIVSQQALGLRVAVPLEALTAEARLQIRRHRDEPFGAGFNPVVQITSGTSQTNALVLAELDIAGRSAPVLATLVVEDAQLKVTRALGQSTGGRAAASPAHDGISVPAARPTPTDGPVDIARPSQRSTPARYKNGHSIRQVVRHAVNQRTEHGQALPTGQWNFWLDSSASTKASAGALEVMQAIMEEILATTAVSTPSRNTTDDWIGSPKPNSTQNSVVVTDLPFTADTTTKLVVITSAQLHDVFGTPEHIFYCTPSDVEALGKTEVVTTNTIAAGTNDLIGGLLDFLTQPNGGN